MSVPITEEAVAPPPEPDLAPDEPLVALPGLVLVGAEDAEVCADGSCW